MSKWISECIENQPEVGKALRDLFQKIHEYKNAANPKYCRGKNKKFLSAELDWFRPGWKHFIGICILFGAAGVAFASFRTNFEAGSWSNLALFVTVPVFVIGVSVAMLARSMSDSGRFAVEYLNESCKMDMFCCLTLLAVLIAFVGQFLSSINWFPKIITAGICSASLGAAIECLAMLAFVIRETIRCSVPSESIRVVSKFAARKLCYGYLKEAYIKLFRTRYRDCMEKWCVGKAIHPPSQYYGHYFRSNLHSGDSINDCEIKLDGRTIESDTYKDFDIKGLEELEKYLKENKAELYLSSPDYESEKGVLGVLNSENVRQNEKLQQAILEKSKEVVRWRELQFVEENEDFWESQESKLDEAVERAVDREDTIKLRAYLDAVNVPLSVLRQVRSDHKVIRDAYGEYIHRGYDFVRLYLRALREILTRQESEQKHRSGRMFVLAHTTRNSVWEETKKIFIDMDYHTMELFTWLVPQLYKVIQEAEKQAESLRKIRAQFGGFYEFAVGWLEDRTQEDPQDVDRMRLVLHDGITKWLLIAIKDPELIEQLCDAGRKIVFGREGIKFTHREVVAQHFVLAGHLISMLKSGEVNRTAIERMFFEQYSNSATVEFDELVRFYLDTSLPLRSLDSYLRKFDSSSQVHTDLLTGSSHTSGFGTTGNRQMSWAFIYLAINIFESCTEEPAPIAEISSRVTNEDIQVIKEAFKDNSIGYGLDRFENWIKNCSVLRDEEEARKIATAEFDEQNVEEWKRKFWEGFSKSIPLISLCLKNGNYKIDNIALSEWRYILPKMTFINWDHPLFGAEGDRFGRSLGHHIERTLLDNVARQGDEESEVGGCLSEIIVEAVGWLEKEGCNGDKGIIIAATKRSPSTELFSDENFVPSWKEEVRSLGFDGFYKGFPVFWLRRKKKEIEKGEVVTAGKVDEPTWDGVVAVDMRGWTGMRVREDILSKKNFGDLRIREWTEQEINKAIESGKLEATDIDKAKGNCPVDVSFFGEFSTEEIPRRKFFSIGHADMQKE